MKIICLDGFKPEYLKYAPYLKKLSENHLHGELETVFAYTGISASFFTGLYPDKHGIFDLFEFSSKKFVLRLPNKLRDIYINFIRLLQNKRFFNRYYEIPHYALKYLNPALDKAWYQKHVLKKKTLFDYLLENDISFAYLDFPHFFDSKNNKKTLFFRRSDKAVLAKMKKLRSEVQIIFLHELDSLSHKYGPSSKEVIKHVRFIDQELAKIKGELIIWSDHGFLKVKGTVNLLSYLKKLNLKYGQDYIYFLGATFAMFKFFNNKAIEKTMSVLKTIKHGKILTDEELKKLHVPKKQDIIFALNPGYIISPDFFDKKAPKGMHGFNPGLKEQKGFYLFKNIKGKRKNGRIIDIMPTILEKLNIPLTEEINGKSLI